MNLKPSEQKKYDKYSKRLWEQIGDLDFKSDEACLVQRDLFFRFFGRRPKPSESKGITSTRNNILVFEYELKKQNCMLADIRMERFVREWREAVKREAGEALKDYF